LLPDRLSRAGAFGYQGAGGNGRPNRGVAMLWAYRVAGSALERTQVDDGVAIPADAVWLDLLRPTPEEDRAVEAAIGVSVPTHEEMQEIEASSRLYEEAGALFMTAPLVTKADTEMPESSAVTFILAGERIVTVRYAEPRPFQLFAQRVQRSAGPCVRGDAILVGLLEAVIDRVADVLERVQAEIDGISRSVFAEPGRTRGRSHDFQALLRKLGHTGDLASKARESLVGIGRLLMYLNQSTELKRPKDGRQRIKTMLRDVQSLSDFATFIAGKIAFLLDATLGLINIEQSNIIKIFSVASVTFLPPTLIASIYGMNFQAMPELDWSYGYPVALGLMVLSAVLPFAYFRRKGWL